MKKSIYLAAALSIPVLLYGCASVPAGKSAASENDQSYVMAGEAPARIPAGKGLLSVKVSFKTHMQNFYPLGSRCTFHGAGEMPVQITINGARAQWYVPGRPDPVPLYRPDGSKNTDPEAGDGMMYTLEKTVLADPGTCRVTLAIGKESISRDMNVMIEPGAVTTLELVPLYRYCDGRTRSRSFYHGIEDFRGKTGVNTTAK